jgi:hypothetical protein
MRVCRHSLLVLALAGCKPVIPPPMVAFHNDTAADPKGETSVMVIVGYAGLLLSSGLGVAVRVEHQQTTRTTVGVELTGGTDEGHWLVAARGYGRGTLRSRDWLAITYGAGLSYMDTGLVTGGLHGGGALSYVNQYAQPYLSSGFALAVPLRQPTVAWGGDGCITCNVPTEPPRLETEVYGFSDVGLAVPIGDSGHQLSLDVGAAFPIIGKTGLISLSVGERYESD